MASAVIATAVVASALVLVSHIKRREDAEKERAAEAQRQGEEWMTRMMESIGDGVFATDGRGRVRLMNPVAQALTGWTQAEAVGRPVEEVFRIVNEQTRQPAENPVFRAIREGVVMGLANHTVLIARDGTETSIDDSAAPIKDRDGVVVGVVMVFQDATERRRHEARLRESEERHRTILESITDAFYAFDRDWRFTYVNRRAEALMGRSREELLGKDVWEDLSRRHRVRLRRPPIAGRWTRGSSSRSRRSTRRTTAGTSFMPTLRRTASRSTSGTSGSGSGPSEERDRLVGQVDAERRHLQAVIESSPDCIKELDLDGRLVAMSENGRRLLEISDLCDVLDRPWIDFWEGEGREAARAAVARALEGGVGSFEGYCPTAAGTPKWWDVVVTPIHGAGGEIVRLLSVSRDITERRRHQEERERLLAEAQDANRAKDDFLAVLSHELRTPLNPILLATTAMLDRPTPARGVPADPGDGPPERQPPGPAHRRPPGRDADRPWQDAPALGRLRLPRPDPAGPSRSPASDALGKNHRLGLDLRADDHCVNADAARLQQVFWNLLKNAIKFTPEGGYDRRPHPQRGRVDPRSRSPTRASASRPDVLPHVFDAFHQGDTRITRKFGGLGAGAGDLPGRRRGPRRDDRRRERRRGPGDDLPGRPQDDARAGRRARLRGSRGRRRGRRVGHRPHPEPIEHPGRR